jgi:hypothetical protein
MENPFLPMKRALFFPLALAALGTATAQLDQNSNQQSDIWEIHYGAQNLPAIGDSDGDGFSNALESIAGTHPLDSSSFPKVSVFAGSPGFVNLQWPNEAGKKYRVLGGPNLSPASFTELGTLSGEGASLSDLISTGGQAAWFFKLETLDQDEDADGLTNWEEMKIGFNPRLNHSDRHDTADLARAQGTLNAASVITVGLVDDDIREDWPDRGVIAIRRSGGLRPLTVNVTFTGTATRNGDYTPSIAGTQVFLPFGAREAWIELAPVNDTSAEGAETIIITAATGTGYSLGAVTSATATINDASALPCAKAAARFLLQAAFGPDQDSTADPDQIPENVEEVMGMGFEAWINDQFTRPPGLLQPFTDWAAVNANGISLFGNHKEFSW